jgi:succinyl-diaminopimelate desuccinylase
MEPEKGDNAVQKLLRVLSETDINPFDDACIRPLRSLFGEGYSGEGLGIECADDISGPLTCNVAGIEMLREKNSKIFTVKLDIRYPVTLDYGQLSNNINLKAAEAGIEVEVAEHKPPLFVPSHSRVVQTLLDAYESVTHTRPSPISIGGGTYCRYMPNAISAGPVFPGCPELAHQIDENISLHDLRTCTHIYAEALARFNEY